MLYWEEWPVRQPSLLFGGLRLTRPDYLELWQRLEADPATPEVLRNLPIRHPLLWVEAAGLSGTGHSAQSSVRNEDAGRPSVP